MHSAYEVHRSLFWPESEARSSIMAAASSPRRDDRLPRCCRRGTPVQSGATTTHFSEINRARRGRRPASLPDDTAGLRLRSIANHLISLAIIAKGFAPKKDWDWLYRAARRIYRQSEPYDIKSPIPISAGELLAWAIERL